MKRTNQDIAISYKIVNHAMNAHTDKPTDNTNATTSKCVSIYSRLNVFTINIRFIVYSRLNGFTTTIPIYSEMYRLFLGKVRK